MSCRKTICWPFDLLVLMFGYFISVQIFVTVLYLQRFFFPAAVFDFVSSPVHGTFVRVVFCDFLSTFFLISLVSMVMIGHYARLSKPRQHSLTEDSSTSCVLQLFF